MKEIIWHGSDKIIEKPTYGVGKTNNDYGLGFYCTKSEELAKEWSCQIPGRDGYANCYELNLENLKTLYLNDTQFTILDWLAILAYNRDFRVSTAIAKKGKEYLLENFLIDTSKYDVIVGYRADDSYFSFARAFVNNEISLKQLLYAMKLGKLGEQIMIKSEKAFSQIQFKKYEIAISEEYYIKRKKRNDEAVRNFIENQEVDDIYGIYMCDIIRERIDKNDARLR